MRGSGHGAALGAAVALVLSGCGGSSPNGRVVIATDLPAHTVRSEGGDLAFSGRVEPADATVALQGADGAVDQERDGRFTVHLLALRPGLTALTLHAVHPGRRPAATIVRVIRDGRLAPRAREPQAASPEGFGAPGASDATGGRIDLAIQGFAAVPRRVQARPGELVSWHNLDHADHVLRFDAPRARTMDTARFGYDQRALRDVPAAGTLRYHCAIHPWVRGEIDVVPAP